MREKILSISVMAHPSRKKFFPYLKERLGDVPFSIDEKSEGVWPNCRRAWGMRDESAKWHLVVQDDAIVCDDFRARAEAILAKLSPDTAVSFYYGRRAELAAQSKGWLERGFAVLPGVSWGVAICLPTILIPKMLEYVERFSTWRDDARISKWIFHEKMTTYYPLPSLIDHRTSEETESIIGDPGKKRCAYKFIDAV